MHKSDRLKITFKVGHDNNVYFILEQQIYISNAGLKIETSPRIHAWKDKDT